MYSMFWRNKWLTADAKSIDDMVASLRAAEELENMKLDGITLDPNGGTEDDHALLTTDDAAVAEKYGLELDEDECDCDCG